MSATSNKKTKHHPIHPGEVLREEYMLKNSLSVSDLAHRIGVSRQTVNELVHEKRSLSTEMALRLAKLFDNSPQFWLNLQQEFDLWEIEHGLHNELKKIKRIKIESQQ